MWVLASSDNEGQERTFIALFTSEKEVLEALSTDYTYKINRDAHVGEYTGKLYTCTIKDNPYITNKTAYYWVLNVTVCGGKHEPIRHRTAINISYNYFW